MVNARYIGEFLRKTWSDIYSGKYPRGLLLPFLQYALEELIAKVIRSLDLLSYFDLYRPIWRVWGKA